MKIVRTREEVSDAIRAYLEEKVGVTLTADDCTVTLAPEATDATVEFEVTW
jgi:hypothetical protein